MDTRTSLELPSGRIIGLITLNQCYTYEGLLMGVPTRRMNEQIMNHLIAAHTEPDGYGVPYLIRGKQKTLHVPDGIRPDAIECRHVHHAREDGLSDHSAMLADVVSMEG